MGNIVLKKIPLWFRIWGTRYRVFNEDLEMFQEILIYKKRIYILGVDNGKEK